MDYIRMEEMKTLRTKFCIDYTPFIAKTDKPPSRSKSRLREPRPSHVPHLTELNQLNKKYIKAAKYSA